MSRELPILFSGPMVLAILAGRKTVTRRLASGKPIPGLYESNGGPLVPILRPSLWTKVVPGDRLWVRERTMCTAIRNTAKGAFMDVRYEADGVEAFNIPIPNRLNPNAIEVGRRLSMGCYREASRINLEVTANKVERLQDISHEEAINEGASSKPNLFGHMPGWSMDWREPFQDHALATARDAFANFINLLHGGPRWNSKPSNLWDENPEVCAPAFKVL